MNTYVAISDFDIERLGGTAKGIGRPELAKN